MPTLPSLPAASRVALLRGVNVGGKMVAMAELRRLATDLGFTDAGTLINSGNLVYRSSDTTTSDDAQRLRDAIARALGVRCTVFVRTRDELAALLHECPLRDEATREPSRLLVTVWNDQVTPPMLEALLATPVTVERFAVGTRAFYCWLPDGISASVPYEKATRRFGEHITARNWSTMQKLLTRLDALSAAAASANGGTA